MVVSLLSKTAKEAATPVRCWREIETVPTAVMETAVSVNNPKSIAKWRVTSTAAKRISRPVSNESPLLKSAPPILDLCTAIGKDAIQINQKDLLGFIQNESDTSVRYNVYMVRQLTKDPALHSLEELLRNSSIWMRMHSPGCLSLNRRDRLYLAASLACSVLRFRGSWLKTAWKSRDILLGGDDDDAKPLLDCCYISWNVLGGQENITGSIQHLSMVDSPLIRNAISCILFSLGLILTELSLCQTVGSLHACEDDDPDEAVTNLNTASRCLRCVYCESGTRYGDVVEKCLSWCGSGVITEELGNDKFEEMVFDSIVLPLLDDLRDFQGI
jgi:hypothetical protein